MPYTCVGQFKGITHSSQAPFSDTGTSSTIIMREVRYQTPHGIQVTRAAARLPYRKGLGPFLRQLDRYRGIYLSSGYEYPGRYSRWDMVSVRPPLEILSFQREVTFRPLNERGAAINRMLATVLRDHPHWDDFREENGALYGT